MNRAVLTLNAGSSSLKFSIFRQDSLRLLCHGLIDNITTAPMLKVQDAGKQWIADQLIDVPDAPPLIPKTPAAIVAHETRHYQRGIEVLAEWIASHKEALQLTTICHRVVHGGRLFEQPVAVNAFILESLEKLNPLAPLHQPHNLAAIRVFQQLYPQLPHIACFDTAFHTTQSDVARRFALPRSLSQEGIERYGFHGLSYEYIAHVLPQYLKEKAEGKVIVAHLGNGASLCAMEGRQSVATSMGFTALDGLMMGSRCGALDPGVVLYLIEEKGMEPQAVARLLYYQSGLKGVSGISHDMRVLLESQEEGALHAIELFTYQLVKQIGAMAATLGGIEFLIFTAGIGEHASRIRTVVCEKLHWLGIILDEDANQRHQSRISCDDSPIGVYVIPTDEERMMAMHGVALLEGNGE